MEKRLFVRYSSLTDCSFRITYLQLQVNFYNQAVLCNCLVLNLFEVQLRYDQANLE